MQGNTPNPPRLALLPVIPYPASSITQHNIQYQMLNNSPQALLFKPILDNPWKVNFPLHRSLYKGERES
jgi:hypothetical protein